MDHVGLWGRFLSQIRTKQIDNNVAIAQMGDLIEFIYPAGFSLWGVSDGEGHIVHFGVGDENMMQKLCRSVFQPVLHNAFGGLPRMVKVRRQPVMEIKVPPGTRIRVNNNKHHLWPSPEDYVRYRCDVLVHQEFTYDLLSLNSEHFATYVRYGQAICSQIRFLKNMNEVHFNATQTFQRIMPYQMETESVRL